MDLFYGIIGSIFGILGIIIVLGAIKNCRELIQVEKEMKAEAEIKKLTSNIVITVNEEFSQDPE